MQKPQKPESKPSLYRWCHSKAHGWTAQSHLVRKKPKPFAHLSGRQRGKARKSVRREAKAELLLGGVL